MTDPMSPEELRACRERAEACFRAPWIASDPWTVEADGDEDCKEVRSVLSPDEYPGGQVVAECHDDGIIATPGLREFAAAHSAFIAHARTDVPRLLATIDALRARTEKAEGNATQFERDWHDAKAEFGSATQERDEQIAKLKDALVANAVGARSAAHARDSAACELDDIATTREMACATRIFGHDHPEFHDLSNAEWVAELLNAYERKAARTTADVSPKLCFGCHLEADMRGASR